MQQSITVENRVHQSLLAQPIRQGVPWPRGAVQPETKLSAHTDDGSPAPLGTRVLNRWPDGSVQWSLVDFAIYLPPSGKRVVTIDTAQPQHAKPQHAIETHEDESGVQVSNGLATLKLSTRPGALIELWTMGNRNVVRSGGFDVVLKDEQGIEYSAACCASKKVCIEDANEVRAAVRVEGKHLSSDGRLLLDFWMRFTVFANRQDVKITYHYRNRELPEPGITLQSMVMKLQTGLPENCQRWIVHSNRTREFRTEPIRLRDDFEIASSHLPDLENYPAHLKGTPGGIGRVFIRQPEVLRDDAPKPWFLQNVADFKFGAVFAPEHAVWSTVGLSSAEGSLLLAGGNMVGLHPKSLKISGATAEYSIWPEWAGPMEITQGEGRTLDFFVGPLPPNATDEQFLQQYFSWEYSNIYGHHAGRSPVRVGLDNEHVQSCEVFAIDKLPAYDPQNHFAFERKVQATWTPDEAAPAHGHIHYGDEFAHYGIGVNNEEMAGLVWFQEYLRTGRAECLDRGLAQAQHIMDVDIVMFSNDPYQNGGMCAHGPRHNHCAAYPSHMWFTELLFAYALTGDEEFKQAAIRVCDNLVFWINDERGFQTICSDGRESGQPLINLAWTYQFVPDQKYMDAMWKIVRGSFMARVQKYGRLIYMKPREDFALLADDGYGQWAAWEGLFWMWELTKDEELKKFILSQLDWRLTEERMATHGTFRATDFNVAAYAFLMTGDMQWLQRVARPFCVAWRASQWQFGWIKSMYFIKLAFEHGLISDDDVLVS